MPIPPADEEGFLPPGVHDCTLEEVRARFGSFKGTSRRQELFDRLARYIRELRSIGQRVSLIINGSFVTGKQDPGDIDLVLVLPADFDLAGELRPFEYNVQSRRMVRRRYGFDLYVALEDSPPYAASLRRFDRLKGSPRKRKGMLRVRL